MNAPFNLKTLVSAAFAAALLGACGIDQGGAPVIENDPPIGAQVVFGPITGFGSVLLNDLTVDSSAATILVDGFPATEADLRVGQIVRIVTLIEDGASTAVLIEYQENVSGPIAAVQVASDSLTILDQQIMTDASTRFDVPGVTSIDDLQPGAAVEISAFRDPGGVLRATYIGSVDSGDPLEISASITAVDLGAQLFFVGALTVDYSQAQSLDLPGGEPEVGLVVEVEGDALSGAGALIATRVAELAADPGLFSAIDTAIDAASLAVATPATVTSFGANFAGFVIATDLPASISVGDVEIRLLAGTTIDGGTTTDLQPGSLVNVVGSIAEAGVIEAERITIF